MRKSHFCTGGRTGSACRCSWKEKLLILRDRIQVGNVPIVSTRYSAQPSSTEWIQNRICAKCWRGLPINQSLAASSFGRRVVECSFSALRSGQAWAPKHTGVTLKLLMNPLRFCRAISCDVPRRGWRPWQSWQCGICNLKAVDGRSWFDPH